MASSDSLPDHLIDLDRECERIGELLRVFFKFSNTLQDVRCLGKELPALLRTMALAIEGRA